MATDIAKLNVELTANSTKLAKEFNKLQAKLDKTERDYQRKIAAMERKQTSAINRMSRGWKSLGVAIAGAVSAGALANFAKATVETNAHLYDLSVRLGISTEALSQLRFAAEQTGVSVNVMEMGLQRMTRRLGEVSATGTGEAKKALDLLGISIKDLQGLAPDQQFKRLADAFAGVSDQGTKLAAAVKIFDTEAVAMLQTMEGGSAEIERLQKRADELGVTLRGDVAKASADLQANVLVLKASFNGLANEIAQSVIPAMADLAAKWEEWLGRSDAMKESVQIQKEIFALQSRIDAGVGRTRQVNPADAVKLENLKERLRVLREIIKEERNTKFGNLPGDYPPAGISMPAGAAGKAGKAGKAGGAPGATQDPSLAALGMEEALLSEEERLEASYLRRQWMLDDALAKQMISQESHQDALKRLEDKYSEDRAKLLQDEGKNRLAATADVFGQLANLSQSSHNDLVKIGRVAGVVQATINAHVAATKALAEGGPFAGPALAAAIYATAIANVAAIEGARALGGPVTGGKPYLVGERGPEIVVPRGSADVIPNNAIGGVNVTIVEDPTRAGEVAQKDNTVEIAVAAVMQHLSREMDTGRGLFAQGQQRYGWRRQV